MSLNKRKWFGLFVATLIVVFSFTSSFQSFVNFPKEIRMFESAIKQLKLAFPLSVIVSSSNPEILEVNGHQDEFKANLSYPLTVKPKKDGNTKVSVKLFGVIPFKSLDVNVMKDIKVIPGGQTIGVKLKSAGIMVVGHHVIQQENGVTVSPAEKAGIRAGDLIIKIGNKKIKDVTEVAEIVNKMGKKKEEIVLDIVRNREKIKVKVNPLYDKKAQLYRLGLYIRDSAAGVGTLTFYDPVNHNYGALGHVITDMDTQEPIIVGDGQILYSNVTSIDKGISGKPGEKRAIFVDEDHVIGNISKNTPFGIFGKMDQQPINGVINQSIPIAFPEEVKEGPAEILTVIEGQKVEKFKIEIVNVVPQKYPATKGMIIKVTDPKLLEKTGGIVQGMSGSPIIQDGKLVGAVTHVFVNDPTSGYGSFIEWMIRDAGMLDDEKLKAS
ncbi:SpoIVB peptidase [Tepidibacillus infernus]|uniref:SpoIVB peptidase n=1 Tax=Tepidibacillus decaturensis TaxID=1413211 RepID=A0A135L2X4_9BACI|nr:SpoIVB peptidase [Tepidibacillus decaturensis]KXG43300.1 SpoIVB peptidase [Tepidibacillus decaturensis]